MTYVRSKFRHPALPKSELGTKFISVLNYDGMPITADNIYRQIATCLTNSPG